MQRLGERLFLGRGLSCDKDHAMRWIRRAAELRTAHAIYVLGIFLLDDDSPVSRSEGIAHLTAAATMGSLEAMVEVGVRLLNGDDLAVDSAAGWQWIERAAWGGDRAAQILLSIGDERREFPMGFSPHPYPSAEARESGLYLYHCSLALTTAAVRRCLLSAAADLFLKGHRCHDALAATNLAYMIRRGEVEAGKYPSLDELLRDGIERGYVFGMANQALRVAAGFQNESCWKQADEIMAALPNTHGIVRWWERLLASNDPEGHLVIGWLVRHGLTVDPEGLEPFARFEFAKAAWRIPAWLT
jgi:Sel1 repeat